MIYYEVKNSSGARIASNIEHCPLLNDYIGRENESIKIKTHVMFIKQ